MNNQTIYVVICLTPDGRYVYSDTFSTAKKAHRYLNFVKKLDKEFKYNIKFQYKLETHFIDIFEYDKKD